MVQGNVREVSFQENLEEIDFKKNSNQFIKLQSFSSLALKVEELTKDVSNFSLIEAEHMNEDGFDFISLKFQIVIVVVFHKDVPELVEEHSDKSVHSG